LQSPKVVRQVRDLVGALLHVEVKQSKSGMSLPVLSDCLGRCLVVSKRTRVCRRLQLGEIGTQVVGTLTDSRAYPTRGFKIARNIWSQS
jgi:hypothetical protein